jgi:hypothetical protein
VKCLATIFLCCWSSVYPNIVAPTDRCWPAFGTGSAWHVAASSARTFWSCWQRGRGRRPDGLLGYVTRLSALDSNSAVVVTDMNLFVEPQQKF